MSEKTPLEILNDRIMIDKLKGKKDEQKSR